MMADRPALDQMECPPIHVLMATYNGALCLDEQLQSFAAQRYPNWTLRVRDDASQDQTVSMLEAFGAEGHQVHISQGKQLGAAHNFMTLVRDLPQGEGASQWVAFSDQDDIWLADRLDRGYAALADIPDDIPALFSSRTLIMEDEDSEHALSTKRPRPPSFLNALVQNIAAGNTILLNPAATALMRRVAQGPHPVVMHDWMAYLLVMGAGGQMVHDDEPTVIYRQHANNEVGANLRMRAQLARFIMLWHGKFRDWNAINITALQGVRDVLEPDNAHILDAFADLRAAGLWRRLRILRGLGLYRQTPIGTLALWFAAVFNRL